MNPTPSATGAPAVRTPATRRAQQVLVAVGVLLLVIGGIVLLRDVSASSYPGLLVWFGGAILLHDGILAPIVFGTSLVLRRAGKRISFTVLLIVQGAVVVAAISTLLFFPEVLKQGLGTQNPTVLPLNYGAGLIGLYIGLALATAAVVAVYLVVRARAARRRG